MGQKDHFDFDSQLACSFLFLLFVFSNACRPSRSVSRLVLLGGILSYTVGFFLIFSSFYDLNSGVAFFSFYYFFAFYFFSLHFVCISILRKIAFVPPSFVCLPTHPYLVFNARELKRGFSLERRE